MRVEYQDPFLGKPTPLASRKPRWATYAMYLDQRGPGPRKPRMSGLGKTPYPFFVFTAKMATKPKKYKVQELRE